MSDHPLVVYNRVSTRSKNDPVSAFSPSRDSARRYIKANPARVLAELTEIESGRSKDRPQLKEALRLCRVYNAKLIVGRLDRSWRAARLDDHGALEKRC